MSELKTGQPRGRKKKIRPETTASELAEVENNAKKQKLHEKKTEEQEFIEKQQKEFEKLKTLSAVVDVRGPSTSSSSTEPTKKLGKIPICKFIPPARSRKKRHSASNASDGPATESPEKSSRLDANNFNVPASPPLTPPLSHASRSGSEISTECSFSPINLGASISNHEHVAKFQLINAWLARKRPKWCVKNFEVLKEMKKKESLLSTFKCMAKTCSYTTISRKNFENHLKCHENSPNQFEFLHFCPYCFFMGSSGGSLLEHYIKHHSYDRFQCGHCFYRSADAHSCWEHGLTYHSNLPRIVYECPLEPMPNDEATKVRLQDNRRRFVLPLHCSFCSLEFFLMDPYEEHMKQHFSVPEVNSTAVNDFKTYENKLVNNQVGRYECLFCEYGTNQRVDFRSHMQEHPTEAVFLCTRKSLQTSSNPHCIESAPITSLPKRSDTNVVAFDEDLQKLKNSSNALIIG